MSARLMLDIAVSQIPPEGTDVDAPLDAAEARLEGSEGFALEAGGSLRCRLERGDDETVHVVGRLSARLGLECGRCLEAYGMPVDQALDLFYLPHRAEAGDTEDEDEVELKDRDMVVAYYRDDRVHLGDMVREQLVLALPMRRVCRPECRGLCPVCGGNRNQIECDCAEAAGTDPRLAPLKDLLGGGSH